MTYIKRIDDMGGAVKAIEQGYIQQEIQDSAYSWQMDVEKDERVVVGLNKFQVKEAPPKGLLARGSRRRRATSRQTRRPDGPEGTTRPRPPRSPL